MYSHAEGGYTNSTGDASHAEGIYTVATGNYSHAEGRYTEAANMCSHASGCANVIGGLYPDWVSGGSYQVGDRVRRGVSGYELLDQTGAGDYPWNSDKWKKLPSNGPVAFVIGNGDASANTRSNAYTLDWDGNAHFAGDVFINSSSDGTGGTKLPDTTNIINYISTNLVASLAETQAIIDEYEEAVP